MSKTIGPYTVLGKIGEGSYGIVYKVSMSKSDPTKVCVLKQISLKGLKEKEKEDFKNESKILKSLNSKYVVKYFDSFEEDNNLNIVMEFCDSGDLCKFLDYHRLNKKPLSEDLIWNFFLKIALGLGYIHKKNILHRDLKNIKYIFK